MMQENQIYPVKSSLEGEGRFAAFNGVKKEHIHFGHFGLILSVAVLLIGVSWMKHPDLFDVFKSKSSSSSIAANLPRYYAYEPPAELNQPLVAGASTQDQGPQIINEDGSLSPAVEAGDVLGMSTENVVLNLDAIKVQTQSDSPEDIKAYVASVQEAEAGYLDSAQFEAALSSGDQRQIDQQAQAVQSIADKLTALPVSTSLVRLHKLKILQYNAALQILKNFTQADENPELINQNLDMFLKAEQSIQDEVSTLSKTLGSVLQQP